MIRAVVVGVPCLGGCCDGCCAEFRVGLAGWVEWRAVGVSECLGMSRRLGRAATW